MLAAYGLYGESSAAAIGSSEDFPHFRVGVAGKAERKPREIRDELIVGLRIHLVGHDVEATPNLTFEMLDPFLREISHVDGAY